MSLNVNQVLQYYIVQCGKQYEDDHRFYSECTSEMGKICLSKITEVQVKDTVRAFLWKWGKMYRVLGQKGHARWTRDVAHALKKKSNSDFLEPLRRRKLEESSLDELEPNIQSLYSDLRKATGNIASTKILHLVCPAFFPMWDNAIAAAVRKENRLRERTKTRIEAFSPQDYCGYMHTIKALVIAHDGLLSNLADAHNRPKIRLLDECFWFAVHSPLSLFFDKM